MGNEELLVVDTAIPPTQDLATRADLFPEQFLRSRLVDAWADWDRRSLHGELSDIAVVMRADWHDPGRLGRVMYLVDREFRRCAKAWVATHDVSCLDADDDAQVSSSQFLQVLDGSPMPDRNAGHLETKAVTWPFALLAKPTESVSDALAGFPAVILAYAIAAFGERFNVLLRSDCRLEAAMFAGDSDGVLPALTNAMRGHWQGTSEGSMEHWEKIQHRSSSRYRAIAPDGSGDGRLGLEIALLRTMRSGRQDMIHVWV